MAAELLGFLAGSLVLMLLIATTQLDRWQQLAAGSGVDPDYVRACDWIQKNTSPATMVVSSDDWAPYLT